MPAELIHVPAGIGYPLLFALVGAESAGALVPGETALIVAAALASQGRLSFPLVVAVAAAAAILGDNLGYVIGRRGLRRLLDRPGRTAAVRRRTVERGEAFFARRGSAAVFFGRWLPGLRVVAAWLAGANRMPWRRFVLWNGLGGLAWASTVGGAAYLLGRTASGSLGAIGLVGVGIVVVLFVSGRIRRQLSTRRSEREEGWKHASRSSTTAPPETSTFSPTLSARVPSRQEPKSACATSKSSHRSSRSRRTSTGDDTARRSRTSL